MSEPAGAGEAERARPQREVVQRHSLVVRLTHWINVICLALLLLSGLRLFNYHPALYWGNAGYGGVAAVLVIGSKIDPATRTPVGITRIAGTHRDSS